MSRLDNARIALAFIGIVVWGYGQRTDRAETRLAGIGVLVVVLLLRFFPKRWLGEEETNS